MDLGLTGRSAVIAGASKGIGLATARLLADEGCDVSLVARPSPQLTSAAAAIADEFGVSATAIGVDLSRSDEIERLWDEQLAQQVPDIVVNNAGAIPNGTIDQIDDERLRAAWDLKLFGYITMTRRAMAAMTERGSGVVVNVIGAGGEKPTPGYIGGAGANAALMAMTRALGSTSRARGVRVAGINPGLIHTERMEELLRTAAERRFGDAERWQEMIDAKHPPGDPIQIAAAVAFLASDLSGNTTGTILTIDGGSTGR